MTQPPVMKIEKAFFRDRSEVYADMLETGYWPTTYLSEKSPELPLHWHDANIIGYLIEGETYVLDEAGARCPLEPGDKLIIPAGALHAEGKVSDPVTYIVTVERCEPFVRALRMLDPKAYPEPKMLDLGSDLMAALGVPPPA